jgi:hypothetical protein
MRIEKALITSSNARSVARKNPCEALFMRKSAIRIRENEKKVHVGGSQKYENMCGRSGS